MNEHKEQRFTDSELQKITPEDIKNALRNIDNSITEICNEMGVCMTDTSPELVQESPHTPALNTGE